MAKRPHVPASNWPKHPRLADDFPATPSVHCSRRTGRINDVSFHAKPEDGWPLHFVHPTWPLAPFCASDIYAVLEFLRTDTGMYSEQARINEQGTLSVRLWLGECSACLTVYPSNTGRLKGNAHLSGCKLDLKQLRAVLLRSSWFSDISKYQPRTTTIIPEMSVLEDQTPLEQTMGDLFGNLGTEGIRSLYKVIERSGINKDGDAYRVLSSFLQARRAPGEGAHPNTPCREDGSFSVCLKNWRQLTNSDGDIKIGPLLEGVTEAQWHNADCILSTETGATADTNPIELQEFDIDFESCQKAAPGQGVGALFADRLRGKWAAIDTPKTPTNYRFYLIEENGIHILVGVFYAPHAGHSMEARTRFYEQLKRAWGRACRANPTAWRILAGDTNLPSLMGHLAGQRTGRDNPLNKKFATISWAICSLLTHPSARRSRHTTVALCWTSS